MMITPNSVTAITAMDQSGSSSPGGATEAATRTNKLMRVARCGPGHPINFDRPRLVNALPLGNIGCIEQTYVNGDLAVDGRLQGILRVGVLLSERMGRFPVRGK